MALSFSNSPCVGLCALAASGVSVPEYASLETATPAGGGLCSQKFAMRKNREALELFGTVRLLTGEYAMLVGLLFGLDWYYFTGRGL